MQAVTYLVLLGLTALQPATMAIDSSDRAVRPGLGFGRVLQTEPIYATVRIAVARRQCWKTVGDVLHGADHGDARRCETVTGIEPREALVGYRVKYRYRGRIRYTLTDRLPGQRIRVSHDLEPIHF